MTAMAKAETKTAARGFKMPKIPIWGWVVIGALFAGIYGYSVYAERPMGGWRYGVCRVFLDLYVRYPDSLRINDVAEGEKSARIGYSSANTFGSMEVHDIECSYVFENNKVRLASVVLDPSSKYLRKRIDDERVKNFSTAVFGNSNWILQQEMDLELPRPIPDKLLSEKDLLQLKRE